MPNHFQIYTPITVGSTVSGFPRKSIGAEVKLVDIKNLLAGPLKGLKTKVITKTISLTSLTAGLFIAAAVIVGAFILTGNNNESDLVTTQDAMTETPKETQSSSNNAQESAGTIEPTPRIPEQDDNFGNFSSSFELIETTSNYTCSEGEYCSFDSYLSEDPLDIISLAPTQISCPATDFELINSSARWDSRNWENVQQLSLIHI